MWAAIPSAFLYPLRGRGIVVLVAGTLTFFVLQWLAGFLFLIGLFLALVIYGYLCAVLMNVVASAANGEEELPEWPDLSDLYDDILQPLLWVIAAGIVSFAPLAVAVYLDATPAVRWLLLGVGVLYMPMSILALTILSSVAALSPTIVIPAIVSVPLDYVIVCAVIVATIFLQALLRQIGPSGIIVGGLVETFLSLYFLTVTARILGVLYFHNADRLGW